jgi:hypothetical protein
MSHADTADKLLIKPAAGARPAPPRTRGQIIPKARTKRPVTRRVTRGTATTRLATTPDRPTRRVLPSPDAAWAETDELRVAERSNSQIKSYVRPKEAAERKESRRCSAATISVGT